MVMQVLYCCLGVINSCLILFGCLSYFLFYSQQVLSPRRDIGIYQSSKARRKKQKDLERQREMEKEYAVEVNTDETRDPAAFVSS